MSPKTSLKQYKPIDVVVFINKIDDELANKENVPKCVILNKSRLKQEENAALVVSERVQEEE